MKIYFNDDTTGIEIEYYNHTFRLEDSKFNETFTITVKLSENPSEIADEYENVPITDIQIKKNNEIVKEIHNTNIKIVNIEESIDENISNITMVLNT